MVRERNKEAAMGNQSDHSKFKGFMTLLQLLSHSKNLTLPIFAMDYPRYELELIYSAACCLF